MNSAPLHLSVLTFRRAATIAQLAQEMSLCSCSDSTVPVPKLIPRRERNFDSLTTAVRIRDPNYFFLTRVKKTALCQKAVMYRMTTRPSYFETAPIKSKNSRDLVTMSLL